MLMALVLAAISGCAASAPRIGSAAADGQVQRIDGVRSEPRDDGLGVSYTGGSCDVSARLLVTESATRVDIRLLVKAADVPCNAAGHPRTASAALRAPLGSRTVWSDGRRFVPFPGSRLRVPARLPEGLVFQLERGNPETQVATPVGGDRPWAITQWTRQYAAIVPGPGAQNCRPSRGLLAITVSRSPPRPWPGWTDYGVRRVGGADAQLLRENPAEAGWVAWRLVWIEAGETVDVSSSARCQGDRVLTATELLALARTLKPA